MNEPETRDDAPAQSADDEGADGCEKTLAQHYQCSNPDDCQCNVENGVVDADNEVFMCIPWIDFPLVTLLGIPVVASYCHRARLR